MKKFLRILGIVAGCIAVFFGLIFVYTMPVANQARHFVNTLSEQQFDDAYLLLTPSLRSEVSKEKFETVVKELSLHTKNDWSFYSRHRSSDTGEVIASVEDAEGREFDVRFSLQIHDGVWKITGFRRLVVETDDDNAGPLLPTNSELVTLTNATMKRLASALEAKDTTTLRSHFAEFAQRQLTPEAIESGFSPLYPHSEQYSYLANNLSPQFTSLPFIDDDGILNISGDYAENDSRLAFTTRYIYEGSLWKLISLKVNNKKSDTKPQARAT